uniref:Putative ovule protein n=1 Tax=Solanum chacoense TaxID=4108 RepID=A0A0V0IPQ7_SOLCH
MNRCREMHTRLKIKFSSSERVKNRLICLLYTPIYGKKIPYTGQKRENIGGKRGNTELRENYRFGSSRIDGTRGVYTWCISSGNGKMGQKAI